MPGRQTIANIVLDGAAEAPVSAEAAHERAVAVYDLIAENNFSPAGGFDGPFNLHLVQQENRLKFDVRDAKDRPLVSFNLPYSPFRSIIRDYFVVCESYYAAIKLATPSRIEAIDVGRRSLHDEGSEMLRERLAKHVDIDFPTSRRLFTLLCSFKLR